MTLNSITKNGSVLIRIFFDFYQCFDLVYFTSTKTVLLIVFCEFNRNYSFLSEYQTPMHIYTFRRKWRTFHLTNISSFPSQDWFYKLWWSSSNSLFISSSSQICGFFDADAYQHVHQERFPMKSLVTFSIYSTCHLVWFIYNLDRSSTCKQSWYWVEWNFTLLH